MKLITVRYLCHFNTKSITEFGEFVPCIQCLNKRDPNRSIRIHFARVRVFLCNDAHLIDIYMLYW
jgi:hypothetical protein